MFEQVFADLRRTAEFNYQMQQRIFKKWVGMWPGLAAPANGPSEQVDQVRKQWTDFITEQVKKQRSMLEPQFKAGLQIIEEAFTLPQSKDPEELRARFIEL